MVRSVTGTMVDVGRGRLQPEDVLRILAAKDRDAAGQVAPPKGLCLWAVGYG
jgi:tRNA pseudouridine38-40 synthase